jgi:hypothetical protein
MDSMGWVGVYIEQTSFIFSRQWLARLFALFSLLQAFIWSFVSLIVKGTRLSSIVPLCIQAASNNERYPKVSSPWHKTLSLK